MAPEVGPRKVPGLRNRKPRAAQPGEVAGVGGHDRVVGQDLAERADDPPGMDARAVPRRRVHDGRPPPRRRGRPVVLLADRDPLGVEHGPTDEALVGRPQEGPRVGRDGALGRRQAGGRSRLDVHVVPARRSSTGNV